MNDIKIDLSKSNNEVFEVFVDGEKYNVEVALPERFKQKQKSTLINNPSAKNIPQTMSLPTTEPTFSKGERGILAPMPGIVISYEKNIGDKVKMGDPVVVLEAMKMYNNLYAPCDGVIKALPFKAGENVKKFDALCVIESL